MDMNESWNVKQSTLIYFPWICWPREQRQYDDNSRVAFVGSISRNIKPPFNLFIWKWLGGPWRISTSGFFPQKAENDNNNYCYYGLPRFTQESGWVRYFLDGELLKIYAGFGPASRHRILLNAKIINCDQRTGEAPFSGTLRITHTMFGRDLISQYKMVLLDQKRLFNSRSVLHNVVFSAEKK